MTQERKVRVFLCHALEDKPLVRDLYQRLVSESWIEPWMDEIKLLPGQDWRVKIEESVETADVVFICMSTHSINKDGFIQKELRYAREIALEKPDEDIFLIPVKLEDCIPPRGLKFFQWADYFGGKKEQSYHDLLQSLRIRQEQLEIREAREKAKLEKERIENEEHIRKEYEEVSRKEAERLKIEVEEKLRIEKDLKAKLEQEEIARNETERLQKENEERLRIEKQEKERLQREERVLHTTDDRRDNSIKSEVKRQRAPNSKKLTISSRKTTSPIFGISILGISFIGFLFLAATLVLVSYWVINNWEPPAPTLSNSRASSDQDGVLTKSNFGIFETVYVVSDLANGVAGNLITSKWYAENVDGLDLNFLIDEADINVTEESFNGTVYFFFEPPTDGWPSGTYKVNVFLNGIFKDTVRFTVR